MNSIVTKTLTCFAAAALLAFLPAGEAPAHGGGNWDAFTIDTVNDNARGRARDAQLLSSEVILGRAGTDEWPLASLRRARDELITIKEEVDEVLEHYVLDGMNLQVPETLHAEPRAGRTVAASGALNAGIALLDHAASFENADDLVAEFYAGGLVAKLYELLEAHGDRMDLYAALTRDEE